MWIPAGLAVRPRHRSFAASGQGAHDDLALVADDLELVNLLRLVDWSADPVQVVVCDACGTVGCASGNYVAVRRLGDFVVLAPPARAHAPAADDFELTDFAEPAFMRARGVPLVRVEDWSRVRDGGAPLPSPDRLRVLGWEEAALVAQLEAPRRLLGDPGGARRGRLSELVAASDPWIDPETLDRLGDPEVWRRAGGRPELIVAPPGSRVSLFTDDDLKEVVLFGESGGRYGLYFEPGLLMVPSEGALPGDSG